LLVILDDLRWPNLCLVWVNPDVTKGTSLAQKIPALIEFDVDFLEALAILFGESSPLPIQSVFFSNKALNVIENGLILEWIFHDGLFSRGHFYLTSAPKLRSTDADGDMPLQDHSGSCTGMKSVACTVEHKLHPNTFQGAGALESATHLVACVRKTEADAPCCQLFGQ
jgi:hypothetical protein